MTAAELMAQLEADPAWVERRQQQEAERLRLEAEYDVAEAPLREALQAVGLTVASVWDLVNRSMPYPQALPVLFEHLGRPYPVPVRDGIARALAVPEAKAGWRVLVQHYLEEKAQRAKQGLAVALAAAADDTLLEDLLRLARDPAGGPARVLLLGALERSKDPRAREALVQLSTDPEVQKEARVILSRLKRAEQRRSKRRTNEEP